MFDFAQVLRILGANWVDFCVINTQTQACAGWLAFASSYFIPRSARSLGCASFDTTRLWQTEQSFVMVTPDLLV